MKNNEIWRRGLALIAALLCTPARADLYQAVEAASSGDLPRAFALFRELAEIGHVPSQENVAVMYVNGEGVAKDNVLGYGWASLATENGGGEAARNIVAQLEPHMTEPARARVAELKANFGRTALEKTLLPLPQTSPPVVDGECKFKVPANPDDHYPRELIRQNVSGLAFLEYVVHGDGRAHDPRVLYSMPTQSFDAAGRAVTLASQFSPKISNGAPAPCVMRIRVKFTSFPMGQQPDPKAGLKELRVKALGGDPGAQLLLGARLEHFAQRDTIAGHPVEWYFKAAQAGLPVAQFLLGTALLTGGAVQQDEGKALLWMTKAANAGSMDAQFLLANYHLRKNPEEPNLAEAVNWLERAVASGSQQARFYLSALLATSPDATRRDPRRALLLVDEAMNGYGTNPLAHEIRAAAFAWLGDFASASKEQAAALRKAKSLKWDRAPLGARLAEYEAGRAWSGDLFAFY